MNFGPEKLYQTRIVYLFPNEIKQLNETGEHWCEPLEIINSEQKDADRYIQDKIYKVVMFYGNGESARSFSSSDFRNKNRTYMSLERASLGEVHLVSGCFLNNWNNRINPSSGHLTFWFQTIGNFPDHIRRKMIAQARNKLPYNLFD